MGSLHSIQIKNRYHRVVRAGVPSSVDKRRRKGEWSSGGQTSSSKVKLSIDRSTKAPLIGRGVV